MSHVSARHPLARRLVQGAIAIGLLAGLCGCIIVPAGSYSHDYGYRYHDYGHRYHDWR
jgi:hypothetical protein